VQTTKKGASAKVQAAPTTPQPAPVATAAPAATAEDSSSLERTPLQVVKRAPTAPSISKPALGAPAAAHPFVPLATIMPCARPASQHPCERSADNAAAARASPLPADGAAQASQAVAARRPDAMDVDAVHAEPEAKKRARLIEPIAADCDMRCASEAHVYLAAEGCPEGCLHACRIEHRDTQGDVLGSATARGAQGAEASGGRQMSAPAPASTVAGVTAV
jgi:hypothetical protein